MNRNLVLWGIVILTFGLIFNYILFELLFETFREDLEPWKILARSVSVMGGITIIGGIILPLRGQSKVMK